MLERISGVQEQQSSDSSNNNGSGVILTPDVPDNELSSPGIELSS